MTKEEEKKILDRQLGIYNISNEIDDLKKKTANLRRLQRAMAKADELVRETPYLHTHAYSMQLVDDVHLYEDRAGFVRVSLPLHLHQQLLECYWFVKSVRDWSVRQSTIDVVPQSWSELVLSQSMTRLSITDDVLDALYQIAWFYSKQ